MTVQVPVGKSGTSSPIRLDVSREVMLAFNGGWSASVFKCFAKAIVRIPSDFHSKFPFILLVHVFKGLGKLLRGSCRPALIC